MPQTRKQNPVLPEFVHVPRKGTQRFDALEHGLLYLAVFLVPFASLRHYNFFFTVSDLLFCLCLICLVLIGRIPAHPLRQATPIWLMGFGMLFVGLTLASNVNGDPVRGATVVGQYAFAYLILLVVLVRGDFGLTHRMAAALVAGLLAVDIHGIVTFYTVGFLPGSGKGVVTGSLRLATLLGNPNVAAAMNALVMPLVLYLWSSGRLKTILALPVAAIFIFSVILTSSNSGLMATGVSILVFSAFIITARLLHRLVVGVSLVMSVLWYFGGTDLLPSTFHARVLNAFASGDISEAGTFESRSELVKEAIGLIGDKKIVFLGLGADQFRSVSAQGAPVHNLYLLLWAEGGILALMGWLLFSLAGVQIWLGVLKAGSPKQVLATIAATISVILLIAMSNAHMYARFWTVPLLMSYGLGLAHLRRFQVSPTENRQSTGNC